MRIFKKEIFLIAFSLLLLVLFTACSSDSEEGMANNNDSEKNLNNKETNESDANNESNAELDPDEKVKLLIAYQWGEDAFNNRYKRLEDYIDNLEVEYVPSDGTLETFEEMFTADIYPDIIVDQNIFALQDLDVIYPLDDLIEQSGFDISIIDPGILDSISAYDEEGRVIGLPAGTSNVGLYINKEVFDAFGVEHPDPLVPMTWSEVMDLAREMTAERDGVEYIGLAGMDIHALNQFAPSKTDPETGEVLVNKNDAFRKYFELVSDFYSIPGVLEDENLGGSFSERRAAMKTDVNLAMSRWLFGEDEDIESIDLVPLPVWPERPNIGPLAGTTPMIITNYSEHKEMALKVLETYYDPEILTEQVRGGTVPPVSDLELHRQFALDIERYDGKNLEAYHVLETARPEGPASRWDEYVDINSAIEAIREGADVNTALRELEEESAAKISEAMAAE